MAWPQDKVHFSALVGGEDLVTPAINLDGGRALLALNYEPTDTGYRRITGFERYDGQTSPSSEALKTDQELQRALIGAVPGSGPVRGVWVYNDAVYAFRDAADGLSGKMYKATASGWSAVAAANGKLAAGGRYEFVNYNFSGHTSTQKMYGVNGVNKAFQFDGTTFTQITTGMTTDTPAHVAAHQNHLWLSFSGGSLQCSPLADPAGTWTPITGANEFAVGDEITALVPVPGDILAIFSEQATKLLYGSSVDDWQIKNHSTTSGAKAWSVQEISGIKAVSDAGLFDLSATQAFGDFRDSAFSKSIHPLISRLANSVVASFVVKPRNLLYHVFPSGQCVVSGFSNSKSIGFTRSALGIDVSCACNGLIGTEDRVFLGADNGYVYEFDKGRNFDGQTVLAVLKLPYNHFGAPDVRKRVRKVTLQLDAAEAFALPYRIDFDYGSFNVDPEPLVTRDVLGQGGLWNLDFWDEFIWTGMLLDEPSATVSGSGKNVSMTIVTDGDWIAPYTLQGITWRYTARRLNR